MSNAVIRLSNKATFQDMLKTRVAMDSKRTAAQVVNKALLTALIGSSTGPGAIRLTRAATAGRIRRDLGARYHAWTFGGKSHAVKLLYLIASKALKRKGVKYQSFQQWNAEVAIEALTIAKARDSSRNFLQAGWLQAAHDLGATKSRPVKPGGRASKGYAVKATPFKLRAVAFNNAVQKRRGGGDDPVAYLIAENGLNAAYANAQRDMEVWIVNELNKMLEKYSDK